MGGSVFSACAHGNSAATQGHSDRGDTRGQDRGSFGHNRNETS